MRRPGTRRPYYELTDAPGLTDPGGGPVETPATGSTGLHVTFLAQSTDVAVNDSPGTATSLAAGTVGRLVVDATSAGTAQLEEDGGGAVGPAIAFDGAGVHVGDPAAISVAGLKKLRCTGAGTVKHLALILGGFLPAAVNYPYCLTGSAPAGWASDFDFGDTDALIGAYGYYGFPPSIASLAGNGATASGAMLPPNGPPDGVFPDMLSQGGGSCGGGSLGKLYYGWASGLQLSAAANMPASADGWLRIRFRSTLTSGNRLTLPFLGGTDDATGLGFVHVPGGTLEWETWDAGGPTLSGGGLDLTGPVDVVVRVAVTDGGRSLTGYAWAGPVAGSGDAPAYRGSYTVAQSGYDPEGDPEDQPAPLAGVHDARGLWANTTIGMSGSGAGTIDASVVGTVTWELVEYVRGEDDPDPFGLLATITP